MEELAGILCGDCSLSHPERGSVVKERTGSASAKTWAQISPLREAGSLWFTGMERLPGRGFGARVALSSLCVGRGSMAKYRPGAALAGTVLLIKSSPRLLKCLLGNGFRRCEWSRAQLVPNSCNRMGQWSHGGGPGRRKLLEW